MKDSPPQKQPSWRHQLASVCIGIAAGFTAGWLITAAFSITTSPWPDIPRLEEAVPIKTAATDLESRPVDLLPTEPEPQQTLQFENNSGDAPSCSECGGMMTRNGSCYKCENCGGTSGCS